MYSQYRMSYDSGQAEGDKIPSVKLELDGKERHLGGGRRLQTGESRFHAKNVFLVTREVAPRV